MKVILDANVLIAAVAAHGLCESLVQLCLEKHEVVICAELLDEVQRNLLEKIKSPVSVVEEFCDLLKRNGLNSQPLAVPQNACRDKNDLYLLGLAESSDAEFLITGDNDLLECKQYGQTLIVTPRQFWEYSRQK